MIRLFVHLAVLLLFPFLVPRAMLAEITAMPTVTDLNELQKPGRYTVAIRVDDHDRKFIFITPTGFKPGQSLPIVFFFHGAGGSAQQASHTYGWAQKAEKENFFAVFAEGLPIRPDQEASLVLNPRIWRDERGGLPVHNVNDVHFFEVLLRKLEETLPVDHRRVYVTGFSNGAGLTFTLGGHFSDRIAAIAPVSSQSFAPVETLARPLSVYYLTGTADPLIPYHGGSSTLPWGNVRSLPPVQDSVDHWARMDGCPPQPQIISDSGGVRLLRYGPGRDNSEIIFTTIEGNGHHWPDTVEPLPSFISGPSLDPFNATDRIWEFFKAHPMP